MPMFMFHERPGRGRRIRLAGAAAAVAAACLAVTSCSLADLHDGAANASASSSAAEPLALPGAPGLTGLASQAATVVPPNPAGPPDDPFSGTPADQWADGAAGIVLPPAKPVGAFSRSQVKTAYQWTRKLLVAGFLDRQTLAGGAPTAFEKVLGTSDRTWFMDNLGNKGVSKDGAPLNSRDIIMSFPPGSAKLIGPVIKVHGSMHAKSVTGKDGTRQLEIHLDYEFVYPVEPPHRAADWMRVVDEVAWTVTFGDWQGAATPFEPSITDIGPASGVSGAECGTTDGFQHPAYPAQREAAQPTDSPSGTPINPYDMGRTTRVAGCQSTTGT